MFKKQAWQLNELVQPARTVLILQPDARYIDPDSLRSALALGEIMTSLDKTPILFINEELEDYFKIIPGSEKFVTKFPEEFDLTILVDTGNPQAQLPDQLMNHSDQLKAKPLVILDHHANRSELTWPALEIVDHKVIATGELIFDLAKELGWPISQMAAEHMVWSILSDSNYLIYSRNPNTLTILGELNQISHTKVNDFYEKLYQTTSLSREIFKEKQQLLSEVEFHVDGKMSLGVVPKRVSDMCNGAIDSKSLLLDDMRNIKGVEMAVLLIEDEINVYKGSTRSSQTPAAVMLARHFGGGGHDKASGFLVRKPLVELKPEIISAAEQVLRDIPTN